jgi:hypothetical protein
MLKYALMAVGAALVIAVVFVMIPTGKVVRQEPHILTSTDAPPAGFVIHDAPPPVVATPDPSATPPNPGANLDTVMQRLRASAASPAAPTPVPVPAPAPAPDATTALQPVVVTPAPEPAPVAPPPTPQWTSVTAQGTRWRMARTDDGYLVSIDLGAGQVANVRVAPAFGNLDTAAVNIRVDYLRDTIKENFSVQSGNYVFARDGSVSIDR